MFFLAFFTKILYHKKLFFSHLCSPKGDLQTENIFEFQKNRSLEKSL